MDRRHSQGGCLLSNKWLLNKSFVINQGNSDDQTTSKSRAAGCFIKKTCACLARSSVAWHSTGKEVL